MTYKRIKFKIDGRKSILADYLSLDETLVGFERTVDPDRGYYEIDVYSTPIGEYSIESVDDWLAYHGSNYVYPNIKNIDTNLIAVLLNIPKVAVDAIHTIPDQDYLYTIQKLMDTAIGEDDFIYEVYARGGLDDAIAGYGTAHRGYIIKKL